MNLFIVESPAKIATIKKFLGKEFIIKASMGHVREIPKKGLGIHINDGFRADFQLIQSKLNNTNELLNLMQRADQVYFAQDLDREGELIAWHLSEAGEVPREKIRRVIFNEITKKAVLNAIEHPRDLDWNLIHAGMCRTVLDRLIGYKLSPLIWNRFESDVPLSIGRVQTVALRILVERDREIESFTKEEFWNIRSDFNEDFSAEIVLPSGKKLTKEEKEQFMEKLKSPKAVVSSVVQRDEARNPRAPFTTATLQQEANSKLKLSASETMKIAQELYEGVRIQGDNKALITYMRTDAVNLSEEAETNIRAYIQREYGQEYLPPEPIQYKGKTKNAQEAHEAIRPVYFDYPPDKVKPYLRPEQFKLYQLIWNKAVACQMASAVFAATIVDIDINGVPFRVKGSIQKFDGFLKVYDDTDLKAGKKTKEKSVTLPPLEQDQELSVKKIVPEKKFTKPPARFTEASLVKFLEKHGIGRPSTYATIIETLLKRNYAVLEKNKFETTALGKSVYDWVQNHFETVVDIEFTARVEDSLDEVAKGSRDWVRSVSEYYGPLKEKIIKLQGFVEEDLEKDDKVCEVCGKELQVRSGKYGQFLGCSGYPECDFIKRPGKKRSQGVKTGLFCEKCGNEFFLRKSSYGMYLACSGYPDCKNIRNKLSRADAEALQEYFRKRKSEG